MDKAPVFEHHIDTRRKRGVLLFTRSLDESKSSEFVLDVVKAVDPNQYGIKYSIESVQAAYRNLSGLVNISDPDANRLGYILKLLILIKYEVKMTMNPLELF